ncbi:MAG: helix-turn-helix transcriptional regulator [Bdellovibrionaceae bacterium]|nr:helix-turn-helix transcriptional regulator [Pseudobdellovibrionaceae bacterium]
MNKKKPYKPAKPFFDKLLKNPEVRIKYEEERVKSEIAMVVKAARIKAELTQAELAEKVGTSQSVIARLESGSDSRTTSLSLLARIASACNASFEFGFSFKKAI